MYKKTIKIKNAIIVERHSAAVERVAGRTSKLKGKGKGYRFV